MVLFTSTVANPSRHVIRLGAALVKTRIVWKIPILNSWATFWLDMIMVTMARPTKKPLTKFKT